MSNVHFLSDLPALPSSKFFMFIRFFSFNLEFMSLFLNKTHQLWRNVYLTCGLLNKDNELNYQPLFGKEVCAILHGEEPVTRERRKLSLQSTLLSNLFISLTTVSTIQYVPY